MTARKVRANPAGAMKPENDNDWLIVAIVAVIALLVLLSQLLNYLNNLPPI